MNPAPVVDTIAPLFQFLAGVGLLILIGWLLDRAFPAKPADKDVEARRAFNERLARELVGRDA